MGYRPENGYSTRQKVTLARNTGDLNFLNFLKLDIVVIHSDINVVTIYHSKNNPRSVKELAGTPSKVSCA